MKALFRLFISGSVVLATFSGSVAFAASEATRHLEFFEARIRPILAQECYECHQFKGPSKGGLSLDDRSGLLRGGNSGPALRPGDVEGSLLIRAIRHTDENLKMPKSRVKLTREVIQDFETWIRNGALDPRDSPPSDAEIEADQSWESVRERRMAWWSFQPVRSDRPWTRSQRWVDERIEQGWNEKGLVASRRATESVLFRRLSFALRGLPPEPRELLEFLSDSSPDAFEKWMDRFLDSPQFGERWARHWMDWIRYAESHGSEGDPSIPNAWRYRDYLIRALNQDVSYFQLVREHLAGDLLPNPRINLQARLNESAIGIAHLRMVFHGFAPTDALDEQVKFTDDQVNVVSKAFQGLTVSCARCHDHKFDPISQRDYYSWFGILSSARPAINRVDLPPDHEAETRKRLEVLKRQIQERWLALYLNEQRPLWHRFHSPSDALTKALEKRENNEFLWPLVRAEETSEEKLNLWRKVGSASKFLKEGDIPSQERQGIKRWDLRTPEGREGWVTQGESLQVPAQFGVATVAQTGSPILSGFLPSGVYSHLHSTLDQGVLHSPQMELDGEYTLWLRLAGDGGSLARYSVWNYPRDGTVYPVERLNGGRWRWRQFPLQYWKGDRIHVEVTTAADQPVLAQVNQDRSWFGIQEAILVPNSEAFSPTSMNPVLVPLWDSLQGQMPKDLEGWLAGYEKAAETSLLAWQDGRLLDEQALFLDELLRLKWLPNSVEEWTSLKDDLDRYRSLEAQISIPIRAPGVLETVGQDRRLMERGNHKQLADLVPRGFLEAFEGKPYQTRQSGRLELAEDMVKPANPLTARVLVNRIWHHLFGKGLVVTTDNFGRLGQPPTHPELLDDLAAWFTEQGGSIKQLIRILLLSDTWQRSSLPSESASSLDPANAYWSHFSVRRLEAEAIRDALLQVSGALDRSWTEGPPRGGDDPVRSVFVGVRRNSLDPFLTLFDAPVPASAQGNRDVTNVPGQSLTLLNAPSILGLAERWARQVLQENQEAGDEVKLDRMFLTALGRLPTLEEQVQSLKFISDSKAFRSEAENRRQEIQANLKNVQNGIRILQELGTQRVLMKRPSGTKADPTTLLPRPRSAWDFSRGMEDLLGSAHLHLKGQARIENGELVLDGQGSYAASDLMAEPLGAKTMEVWIRLSDLNQRGGGVMTVQNNAGEIFDSIVFAEQQARRWLAGSDVFNRTQPFHNALDEHEVEEAIHLVWVYRDDGEILGYRNGVLYGEPYRSSGLMKYAAKNHQVLLGNRHGDPSGNRLWKGRILKARLYARDLSSEEVNALFRQDPDFVSRKEQLAALSPLEKEQLAQGEADLIHWERVAREMESRTGLSEPWADLAHAIFNLKEFIYIQ